MFIDETSLTTQDRPDAFSSETPEMLSTIGAKVSEVELDGGPITSMSALGQKQTCSAVGDLLCARSGHRGSLDHRGREQRLRNGQAERFCGLEIDDQFDFRQRPGCYFFPMLFSDSTKY
jgi:hypothetical protein